jgi:hypothetical protein
MGTCVHFSRVVMQWLGDLRRCGITDREFRYVRGKYPAIGIGKSFQTKASIAAGFISKLEGTADFEKAGGAIIQIEDSGGDGVDFDALTNWIAKSEKRLRSGPRSDQAVTILTSLIARHYGA